MRRAPAVVVLVAAGLAAAQESDGPIRVGRAAQESDGPIRVGRAAQESDGPIKLKGEQISSKPTCADPRFCKPTVDKPAIAVPQLDYEGISKKNMPPAAPWHPLAVQGVATVSVVLLLVLVAVVGRWYLRRRQLQLLLDLPESCPDGTWLVVAYEWDADKISSGRMPLEGITTISMLLSAAVEYGAESVSEQMHEGNVDVKYMDQQGVERRVGAKTRFDDVKKARLLRIRRREGVEPYPIAEKASLIAPVTKITPKSCDALDNDDMSMVAPHDLESPGGLSLPSPS